MGASGDSQLLTRWRHPGVVLATVVTLVTLAAGCGSGASRHAVRDATAIRTHSAPVTRPTSYPPLLQPERLPRLRSTAHLAELHWRLLAVADGGKILHLAVTWSCGLPPIGERLEQNSSMVTIIIYDHRLPAGFVCAPALGGAVITVTLAAPLAGRRLAQ